MVGEQFELELGLGLGSGLWYVVTRAVTCTVAE